MNKLTSTILLAWFLLSTSTAFAQAYRTYLRKANDQYELKAFSQAIESYQEVLSRKADEPEALERIAACYASLNQMEQAADYLAKLVRQRNFEPRISLQFGHILKSLGRYEEAKNYYLQYARNDPSIGNHFAKTCDFALAQQSMRSDYSISEERVNATASDFGPAFYNNQVVFSSSRTDVQRSNTGWDGIARAQLFVSQIGSNNYLEPATLLKLKGQNAGEGPASFTSDGRFVAYTKNNFVSGVRQIPDNGPELSIFLAEVNTEGAWLNERSFIHNTPGKTGYPCYTTDGQALFFAAERADGYGGFDLYISYKDGSSWSKPVNLGPEVNTPGDEISPFFDGTNLYFASDWHDGFGGMDIFLAESSDGRWAKVSNVGLPINSSRDDYGFIFNSARNYGILVSNRPGGRGADDLYHISKGGSGQNVVLRVINAADGTAIPGATIDLSNCLGTNKVVYADYLGQYTFPIDLRSECEATVTMASFQNARVLLSPSSMQYGREIEVKMIKEGGEYFGFVVSSSTQLPVQGVDVSARNLNNGSVFRTTTDRFGSYALSLSPNTAYVITYAARNYRELSRTVNTLSGIDKTILGNTPLTTFDVYVDEQPDVNPKPTPTTPITESGFSIQVASMSMTPDLTKYAKLSGVGSLYATYDKGAYKVRVGPYGSREAATGVLPSVKRLGYTTAFIVAEAGGQSTANPTTPPINTTPDQIRPLPVEGQIMIQLGAYSNPKYFDASKVSLIGPIVDRFKGNLTIKLITGFYSLDEAKKALPAARQAGFTGAFLVREQNGVLVKIP